MALNYDSIVDTELEHGGTLQQSGLKAGPLLRLSEASETENGDTGNDLSDMKRLGKKQEFKVIYIHQGSIALPTYVKVYVRAAEFWLLIYFGVYFHLHGYLGIRSGVSRITIKFSSHISMADLCTVHLVWD